MTKIYLGLVPAPICVGGGVGQALGEGPLGALLGVLCGDAHAVHPVVEVVGHTLVHVRAAMETFLFMDYNYQLASGVIKKAH